MHQPDYAGAIAYALGRLEKEISADYVYHDIVHTRDHVLPATRRLAELSGCDSAETGLLSAAAAFHDLGFIDSYANHELASVRLAAQQLPHFGFSSRSIELILGMIIATRMPQLPQTDLEMILADADLSILGQADFSERNWALRQELANIGQATSEAHWINSQLAFVESHTYFTAAARTLYAAGKRDTIALLRARLHAIERG